jgi:hypothetical protein
MMHKINEGKSLNSCSGRPPLLNNENKIDIMNEIALKKELKQAMNEGELRHLMYKRAVFTDQNNGGNGIMRKGEISKSSVAKYSKMLNINKEKGQKTTNARRDAMFDVRNFISMAVMNASLSAELSHHCIGNIDATQFLVNFTDQQKLISIDKFSPTTKTQESTMDIFIKQFFLVNAVGFSGPPLFVISHNLLNEDEMVVLPIDGLSFSYDGKSTGYIVFCNSRGGNKLFFNWLFTTYIVESVNIFKSRQVNNDNFYLVLDGEATQIQSLDDVDVRNILNNNKIDIGKGPASCSGCCGNALDCGNFFKSIKTSLRGKSGIGQENSPNSELELFINNKILQTEGIRNITADRRNKICKGIVHLMYYEMKSFSFSIHQKSFEMIGMIGENKLERTLSCSPMYKNIPLSQLQLIKSSMDILIRIFNENGEIKEKEYDDLGIMKREGEEEEESKKDELVVYRQRAVLLTSFETIKRRNDYLNGKKIEKEEGEKKKKDKQESKERRKEEKEEKERKRKRKREEKDETDQLKEKEKGDIERRERRMSSLRGGEGKWKKSISKKGKGGRGDIRK